MNLSDFAAKEPYPSLEGIGANRHDLEIIYNDYAGRISEFSAITQYVYHQLEAKGDHEEQIGSSLLAIAQVEMRHLNILGMLMIKLGGNPRFFYREDGALLPWQGSLIDGEDQIVRMLKSDLWLERQTIASYRWQGGQVSQPQITAVLNRLILDEEIHVNILERLLKGAVAEVDSSPEREGEFEGKA